MTRLVDLCGQRFGRLLISSRVGTDKHGQAVWLATCDCGATSEVLGGNLRRGLTASCGKCVSKAKHGMYGTPVYWVWNSMVRRCKNPTSQVWKDYGGRGIRVCDRWQDFENFYADMGEPPEGHSLDRIDVNGNYEPGNCRWATKDVQQHNVRARTSTGHLGISWSDERQRYVWRVMRHGQSKQGRCLTLDDAIAARDAATAELYGATGTS